jgi:hypothetical protein
MCDEKGVAVLSPHEWTQVDANMNLLVTGTVSECSRGDLWIVVWSARVRRFYPQQGPIHVEKNQSWQTSVTIGDSHTRNGEEYQILALRTSDSSVSHKFRDFIKRCDSNRSDPCPSMTALPGGVNPGAAVTVFA